MDEAVQAFLEESHENLQLMEQGLLRLEEHPGDSELLAEMFRTIHTIKGTCGFLGYSRLQSLSHAGESLLAALRDGTIVASAPIVDVILELVDQVRRHLSAIEMQGSECEDDAAPLLERLAAATTPEVPAPTGLPDASREPGGTGDAALEAAPAEARESSVRVDVALLDHLLGLAGELVLARNQLVPLAVVEENPALAEAVRRIERSTDQLQAEIMRTRMRPLDSVFQMAPRLVRRLARSAGKRVRLHLEGGETELDRGMLDAIRDPLVHLLRNAVDHGIESPEARMRSGKPAEGRIRVNAFHHGGLVTVEVEDDGAGVDLGLVRHRAIETGLLRRAEAEALSDRQVLELIFRPGFSTTREVTGVSGRGVGMDVVRVSVERAGGSVEVASTSGAGTCVRLRIPLTLAILPVLLVEDCDERYAIPQASVQEVLLLGARDRPGGIEVVGGLPVLRLRDRLMPLVLLRQLLWPHRQAAESDAPCNVVVVKAQGRFFGLVVESVHGVLEIVVKPLGPPLNRIPLLAGATVLGDGSVALILDVGNVAQEAQSGPALPELADTLAGSEEGQTGTGARNLLLVRSPHGHHAVIPVDTIERMEMLPVAALETLPGLEVVQYRGGVLPIVRISNEPQAGGFSTAATPAAESIVVVVFDHLGRRTGLVVGDLVDIVEATPALEEVGRRPGVVGSVIVRDRVAELVDVEALVAEAAEALGAARPEAGSGPAQAGAARQHPDREARQ